MYKILFSFICLFPICAQAAILRCNNNPLAAGPNVYATAQAAHDAANAGDTIHLEPTTFGSYGNLALSKKLTIISIGDFLGENPSLQIGNIPSSLDYLGIGVGAEFSVISCFVNATIDIGVGNILIKHSRAQRIHINEGFNDITLQQSWFGSVDINASSTPTQNITIKNNYVWNAIRTDGQYVGALILNNIIKLGYSPYFGISSFQNCVLTNNIFWNDCCGASFNNCVFSNNICDANVLPAGFGNLNNVDFSTVFQNWGSFSGDNYQLSPTYTNQNIGMFAGAEPYRLGNQPNIPSIYQLNNAGTNNGSTLQIQLSTKSN